MINREKTQKHFSRTCVVRLQPYMLQPPDVSTSGLGPQVNRFEQVSSDGHQMSLAWGSGFDGVQCLMSSREEGKGWGQWEGLYNEVHCIMVNGTPSVNRQTPVRTLSSCNRETTLRQTVQKG